MDNLFLLLFLASIITLIIGLVKPTIFSRFLKKRATRKGVTTIFGISTVAFYILFAITTDSDTSSVTKQKNQINQRNGQTNAKTKTQSEPIAYEIVASKDISLKALGNKLPSDFTQQELVNLPINKRMRYTVVVSPEIKEYQVRPTVEKIISDITVQDNDIDEIILFLYSDKNIATGAWAYDVATATWAPNKKLSNVTPEIAESNNRTNYEINIQVKEDLEEYLQQRGQAEEKLGLKEEERHQIFKEIVAAEDEARVEAEEIYPTDISNPNYKQENIMKNIDKERELASKYKAQVRVKYGITEDVESKITVEALEESWPLE